MNGTDDQRALRELHDASRVLAASLTDVLAAFEVDWVGRSIFAEDRGLAVAIAHARAYATSMHAVVVHVLALEHLLDERHLPQLVTQRPVLIAEMPLGPTARDSWRRAVECLAYGAGLGAASAAALRERSQLDALAAAVEATAKSAEVVADALTAVEPVLSFGVNPSEWTAVDAPEGHPPEGPAAPAPQVGIGGVRRKPWWGRMEDPSQPGR